MLCHLPEDAASLITLSKVVTLRLRTLPVTSNLVPWMHMPLSRAIMSLMLWLCVLATIISQTCQRCRGLMTFQGFRCMLTITEALPCLRIKLLSLLGLHSRVRHYHASPSDAQAGAAPSKSPKLSNAACKAAKGVLLLMRHIYPAHNYKVSVAKRASISLISIPYCQIDSSPLFFTMLIACVCLNR